MNYPWMLEAKKHIGIDENKDGPVITQWVKNLKLSWFTAIFKPNTVAWCAVYVTHCFQVSNISIPKNWMRAKDWCNWGIKIAKPMDGCVVVFEREGGGHVGFVVGETVDGFLSVLGGNQKNKVSIAKFNKDRVVGYYWPKEVPVPSVYILSKVYGGGEVSTNEA